MKKAEADALNEELFALLDKADGNDVKFLKKLSDWVSKRFGNVNVSMRLFRCAQKLEGARDD